MLFGLYFDSQRTACFFAKYHLGQGSVTALSHGMFLAYFYKISALIKVTMEGEKVFAHVTVTNSGNMAGEEIVQLYIRDLVATTFRPILELKNSEKVALEAGASSQVKLELLMKDLSF